MLTNILGVQGHSGSLDRSEGVQFGSKNND